MVHKPVPLSDVKPRILLILGAMVARFQQVHERFVWKQNSTSSTFKTSLGTDKMSSL